MNRVYDAIVVGAGPAGTTAAVYMARFQRSVLMFHDGESRASWIPESHNLLGFPSGISGNELLARLNSQAARYGVQNLRNRVETVERTAEGHFRVIGDAGTEEARYVVLATGIKDRLPTISCMDEALRNGMLRVCPICDAYEARGQSLAILGDGPHAQREASFLADYSQQITFLRVTDFEAGPASGERGAPLAFPCLNVAPADLSFDKTQGLLVRSPGEPERVFEICYAALGCTPQLASINGLQVQRDSTGAVKVNEHQQSSESGLYVAGDAVRGLNQKIMAMDGNVILHGVVRSMAPNEWPTSTACLRCSSLPISTRSSLNTELLRRDQTWLVERDVEAASKLLALVPRLPDAPKHCLVLT